jgi:hypothetical protein
MNPENVNVAGAFEAYARIGELWGLIITVYVLDYCTGNILASSQIGAASGPLR